MVAIVGGEGLGLFNSSLAQLNGFGANGSGNVGKGQDRVYVNAVNGNLIVQSQDDYVAALGLDVSVARTYNSRGTMATDADNWQLSFTSWLADLPAVTAGIPGTGPVTRVNGDGYVGSFVYDTTLSAWKSIAGAGAHDVIRYQAGQWVYEEGTSGRRETYDSTGRLLSVADRDNNLVSYFYTSGRLTEIRDASLKSGASVQSTFLDYSGNNVSQIRVVSDGVACTRVRYTYDTANRLQTVKVDIQGYSDNIADSAATTFTTSYEYEGDSRRISRISESDGSSLSIDYVQIGDDYQVSFLAMLVATDKPLRTYRFDYNKADRTTSITDDLEATTTYTYDVSNRLIQVDLPKANGVVSSTAYEYDTDNNISKVSISIFGGVTRVITYTYVNGNLTQSQDSIGNTVRRTYSSANQVLTETTYPTPPSGSPEPADRLITNFVYDTEQHLRFIVSPDGRVTEHQYDTPGNLITTISYGGLFTDTLSSLSSWASAQDKTKSTRVDRSYDFRGQISTITTYAAVASTGQGITDGTESVAQYVYDQAGQLLQTIDPGTAKIVYTYDGLGRVLTKMEFQGSGDTNGRLTKSTYDDVGNTLVVRSDQVGESYRLETTSVYDRTGELISQVERDSAGQKLSETVFSYDFAGQLRIVSTRSSGGDTLSNRYYFYDQRGWKIGEVSGEGELQQTEYDSAGAVTRMTTYAGVVNLGLLYDEDRQFKYDVKLAELIGGVAETTNKRPTVDINGAAAGIGYNTVISGTAAFSIVDVNALTVSDGSDNGSKLLSARVQIVNVKDGSAERLSVTNKLGSGLVVDAYNVATGVLDIRTSNGDPRDIKDFQDLLRTLKYQNTSATPSGQSRTIQISVNDGIDRSQTAVSTLTLTAVPVIDINGASNGADFEANYTEGNLPVSLVDAGATLLDADSATMAGATIRLRNVLNAGKETLSVTSVAGITASYNASTGLLLLSGVATKADYQSVLRTLTYQNTSQHPTTGNRYVDVIVSDGTFDSQLVTSTITVSASNDAPTAAADSFSGVEDTQLIVGGSGVVLNDTDPETDQLSAVLVTEAAHGIVTLSANGSFIYTPVGNYNGADSFTYKVNDGTSTSNFATVSLTIAAVDDTPTANADAYTTTEDTALSVAVGSGLLANDSDVEGSNLILVMERPPSHGQLLMNTNGSFTYLPDPDFYGVDTFEYRVNDGFRTSSPATVTFTVTPVNDAPAAAGDTYAVAEDGQLLLSDAQGVLANDRDVDGTALTVQLVSGPVNGVLALLSTGGFTYRPNANYVGIDTFTYQVSDGNAISSTATVTLNIVAVNDPTVVDLNGTAAGTGFSATFNEGSAPLAIVASSGLTLTDIDSVTLRSAVVRIRNLGDTGKELLAVTPAAGITQSYDASTGVLTLTGSASPGAYQTTLRTLTYRNTSTDPLGGARYVEVTVNDGISISAPVVAVVSVMPQDTGPLLDLNGSNAGTSYQAAYTEDAAAIAIVGASSLTLTDTDTPTVSGATIYISNIYDVGSETLSIGVVAGIESQFDPQLGRLTLTGDSSLANYQSLLRTLKYRNTSQNPTGGDRYIEFVVSAGGQNSASVVSRITVVPVNDAATVIVDTYSVPEDGVLTVANQGVLSNDSDPEGQALTVQLVTPSTRGTVSLSAQGGFTYRPNANAAGTDTFSYKAWDGLAWSATTQVTITITPVNDAPIVDLNGNGTGADYSALFAEDGPAVSIVDSEATIADIDSTVLTGATIRISNLKEAGSELLTITLSGGLTSSFNAATGTLTLSGNASASVYQTVIRTLKYQNIAADPLPGDRLVEVTVTDGIDVSDVATSRVLVQQVLDSLPSLDLNGDNSSIDTSATFLEGTVPTAIAPSASILGNGYRYLQQIAIELINPVDGQSEVLNAQLGDSGLSKAFSNAGSIFTLYIYGYASVETYQQVLRSVTYANNAARPSTSIIREIGVQALVGSSWSNYSYSRVTVQATDTAAFIDSDGDDSNTAGTGFRTTFVAGKGAVALLDSDFILDDADSDNIDQVEVTLSGIQNGGFESLTATLGLFSGITKAYSASTGKLTLSGSATIEKYREVLASLRYSNTALDPTPGLRTIQIKVRGVAAAGTVGGAQWSNAVTVTLSVVPKTSTTFSTSAVITSDVPNTTAYAKYDDPNNRSDILVYDAAGRLVFTIDGEGFVTETVYDGLGRKIREHHYASLLAINAIDGVTEGEVRNAIAQRASQNQASIAADRTARLLYDKDGHVQAMLDGEGYLTEHRYDAHGRLIGTIAYATATSSAARVSGDLNALRPAAQAADKHSYLYYDADSREVARLDSSGVLTETAYDTRGNVRKKTTYNGWATYDATKTVATLRSEALESVPGGQSKFKATTWTYDLLGRVETQLESAGDIATGTEQSVVKTNFTYDLVTGFLTKTTIAAADASDSRISQSRFDALGRVTQTINGRGSVALAAATTAAAREAVWTQYGTSYGYDLAGNRISATDPEGNVTLYYYDRDSRLRYTVRQAFSNGSNVAEGEVSEVLYNAFGDAVQHINYAARVVMAGLSGGILDGDLAGANRLDDANRVSFFQYDRRDLLKSQKDGEGFKTAYGYNAFGEIESTARDVGDTPGSVTRLDLASYDRRGLLLSSTADANRLALKQQYGYDAFARQTSHIDALNQTWATAYNDWTRTVSSFDPLNGTATQTAVDAFSRTVKIVDKLGFSTQFAYNDAGLNITRTSAQGVQTKTTYNVHGQTASVALTNISGIEATYYEYNKDGQLTKTTDPSGKISQSEYDEAGRLLASIDGRGIRTVYTYDGANRVLTRSIDPGGLNLLTSYEYDAFGGARRVTESRSEGNVVTEAVFDHNGRSLLIIEDASGLRLAKRYTYDGAGHIRRLEEGLQAKNDANTWFASNPIRVTNYFYDSVGRKLSEALTLNGSQLTTNYDYDANGNLTRRQDARGNYTWFTYDALNRQVYTVDPTGAVTELRYDKIGQVIATVRYAATISTTGFDKITPGATIQSRISAVVNPAQDRQTLTVYDKDGRASYVVESADYTVNPDDSRTLTASGLRHLTQTKYDNAGRVLAVTQFSKAISSGVVLSVAALDTAVAAAGFRDAANDQTTRYEYFLNGWLKKVTDAKSKSESYTYDNAGNRKTYTNKKGGIWKYEYDAANRVIEERIALGTVYEWPAGAAAPAQKAGTYHKATQYAYDQLGNVTDRIEGYRTTDDVAGSFVELRKTSYAYDARGLQILTTQPVVTVLNPSTDAISSKALKTQTWYDEMGQGFANADAAGNFSYKLYDGAGRVSYEVDAERYVTGYEYDGNGNVVKLTRYAVPLSETGSDGLASIEARIRSLQQQPGYNPDSSSARDLVVLANGAARSLISAILGGGSRAVTTIYDADNRKQQVTQASVNYFLADAATPRGTASPTTSFTYNSFGDVLTESQLRNPVTAEWVSTYYGYDQAGRLTDTIDALGYYTKSSYDVFGRLSSSIQYAKAVTPPSATPDFAAISVTVTSASMNDAIGYDRRTDYIYDQLNRVIQQKLIDVKQAQHNASNGIDSVADATQITKSEYDELGNVIATYDALNKVTRTYYDQLGRVTGVLAPKRAGVSGDVIPLSIFGYDILGNVVFEKKLINGATSETSIVPASPSTTDDQQTSFRYDALGRVVETVDAMGKSEYTAYDAVGHVAKIWRVQSDLLGDDIPQTLRERQKTTFFVYDRIGRQVETRQIILNPVGDSRLEQREQAKFNAFGEQIRKGVNDVADPLTASETDTWDEYADYDEAGRLWQTNHGGVTTAYELDLLGNVTAQVVVEGAASSAVGVAAQTARLTSPSLIASTTSAQRTEYVRDKLGRVVVEQQPIFTTAARSATGLEPAQLALGKITSYVPSSTYHKELGYDEASGEPYNRFITDYKVDTLWDNLAGYGSGDIDVTVTYRSTKSPNTNRTVTIHLKGENSYGGASLTWSSEQIDVTGEDAITQIISISVDKKLPDGSTKLAVRTLTASGNTLELTLPKTVGLNFNNSFQYKQASASSYSGITTTTLAPYVRGVSIAGLANGTYQYLITVNQSSTVDNFTGDGSVYGVYSGTFTVTSGVVTAFGAPTQAAVSNRPTRTVDLDRWGNVLRSYDPRNSAWVTTYRYDHRNQVISEQLPDVTVWTNSGNGESGQKASRFFYDAKGQLIGRANPMDHRDRYFFDAQGNQIKEIDALNGTTQHVFDGLGRERQTVMANGFIVTNGYDRLDRLITMQNTGFTAADARYTQYGYDELGNRVRETVGKNDSNNLLGLTTRYRYDTAGRLVQTLTPMAGADTTTSNAYKTTYGYDARGELSIKTNGNGDAERWDYDSFGRVLNYTDIAGVLTQSAYDGYGRLWKQVNKVNSLRATASQNLEYTYYENGWLKQVRDGSAGNINYYEYDVAGNHVLERFINENRKDADQEAHLGYDAQNRLIRIRDRRYLLEYGYDAAGNRARIRSEYATVDGGTTAVINAYYTYDAVNRMLVSQGMLVNGVISVAYGTSNSPGRGASIEYDAAGRRVKATSYGGPDGLTLMVERYVYDAGNKLQEVWLKQGSAAEVKIATRKYDKYDRVVDYVEFDPNNGLLRLQRQSTYNDNGWLIQQNQNGANGQIESRVTYNGGINDTGYDLVGNALHYQLQAYQVQSGPTYTNSYTYTYIKFGDRYLEAVVEGKNEKVSSGSMKPGRTSTQYDANGIAKSVSSTTIRTLYADYNGLIYKKVESGLYQYYYYGNGNSVGSASTDPKVQADFDYNYTPVTNAYESKLPKNAVTAWQNQWRPRVAPASDTLFSMGGVGSSPTTYVVQSGDTLQSIARSVYGDAGLWYLVADANGLQGSEPLTVGFSLRVPTSGVTNLRNASDTFKPYRPGDLVGDTTPQVQWIPPPPKQRCGGLAQVLVIVVAVVVTVVVSAVATPGPGAAAGQATAATFASAAAGAATGAAAGSVAGQLTAMALGLQDHFSFSQVAMSAAVAGLTAGIAGPLGHQLPFIGQVVVQNIVRQGVNMALQQQQHFSWTSLAASAVTASVFTGSNGDVSVNGLRGVTSQGFDFSRVASDAAVLFSRNIVQRGIQVALEGHGKIDVTSIAADSFGNALGNSIVGQIQQAAAEKQAAEIEQGIARQSQVDNEQLDAVIAQSNQEFSDQIDTDFNAGVDRDLDLFAVQQTESRLVSDSVAGFSSPNLRGLTHQAANVNFEVAALNQSQSCDGAPFYIDRNSAGNEGARGFNSQLAAALNSYRDTYAEGLEPKPIVQGWFGGGFTAGGSLSLGKMFEVEAAVDFGSATANVFDWNGDRTAMQQFELSATIAGISLGFELERSGPTLADLGPWKFVPHVFDVELSNHDFVLEIENKNLFRTGVSANLSEIGRQTESYMNRQVAQLITASYKQSMPEANLPHTDLSEYIRRQEIDKAD